MADKPLLRSLVPDEVASLVAEAGAPTYRAQQLREWLYRHDAMAWDQMGNLPGALRQQLAAQYDLTALTLQEKQVSADRTRKFLFRLRDGHTIESVIIPMAEHATFCLSTQVGCAMACTFCATARGGLVRNLETGEIIEQIQRLRLDLASEPLPGLGGKQFNVVFMGMGEPLDNWPAVEPALRSMMHADGLAMSRRRIQVSTSGPAAGLRQLIAGAPGIGLTLSLGGSTDAERRKVMPVPGRTTLQEALTLAADYGRQAGRRVTVAWVLIKDRTDAPAQAERLARLLRGGSFKVNLIPLNPLHDSALAPTAEPAVLAFQKILTDAGVAAFIRASGGRDIDAACGQLRRRRQ
jgi:23S rRNA (adenine2503-C2)-methyltransferase